MKITLKTKLIAVIILVLVSGTLIFNQRAEQYTQTLYDALDTVTSITVISKTNSQKYAKECTQIIYNYDELFSISKPQSDFYKINNAKTPVTVSPVTIDIISACGDFYSLSEKSFDITGGALYRIWSDAIKTKQLPDTDEIKTAMTHSGFSELLIDKNNLTITKKTPEQQLNAGAVAKGYITDKIKEYLKTTTASGAIIDLGGNILAYGKKNGKTPWSIGISTPENDGEILLSLSLSDKFVITSGDYQRYFDYNGIRYHHIIDARIGYPSKSGLKSVTIISDNGFMGDALSTVCFLAGLDKGIEIVKSYGVSAVFVTDDNKVFYSAELSPIAENKNPSYSFSQF